MGIGNVLSLLTNPFSWIVIALVVFLGWVGNSDFEEELRFKSSYCRMVEQYRATGGEFGWPDYEERYDEDCP